MKVADNTQQQQEVRQEAQDADAIPGQANAAHKLPSLTLQAQPAVNISEEEARKLTERIQNAGTEVVEAKVCLHLNCLPKRYDASSRPSIAERCTPAVSHTLFGAGRLWAANSFARETNDRQITMHLPKAGKGSATLSMAYAAAAFAESCLKAMAGESDVTEYAYVDSSIVEGVPFFASKVCWHVHLLVRHSHNISGQTRQHRRQSADTST